MESNPTQRNILTVENPRGEYAVLPSTLSRRTKARNDSIQNKFLHTSLCLETQRRKYRSYHNVESAKHQNALLNFRRSLKQRPWRGTDSSDETSNVFSADVSNLSPVELSKFQLMRQIVAALPGEKVMIEDICSAMNRVGRTFTKDKDNQAVPLRRSPWRSSIFLHNGALEANKDLGKCRLNMDNEQQHEVSLNVDEAAKATSTKMTTIPVENVTAKDSKLVPTTTPSSDDQMDSNVNTSNGTQYATSGDSLTVPSQRDCFQSEGVVSEKPSPVFITEVNYKLLKSDNKSIAKVPKVKRHHPVWQIRPQSPQGVTIRGPRVDKRTTTPVIRHTDPYGVSYKSGAIHKVTSNNNSARESSASNAEMVTDHHQRLLPKQPMDSRNDTCGLEKSGAQDINAYENRPLSRTSANSANKKSKFLKTKPFAAKPRLTKTISWKEPLATTAMVVDWDNETKLQHKMNMSTIHESDQIFIKRQPTQPNRTIDDINMTTSNSQRSEGCDSLKSKSLGSAPSLNNRKGSSSILKSSKETSSFLIMHQETESVCKHHRRWLVKTPDYLP